MVVPEAVMTLEYDGTAVEANSMEVRQVAPALIAAADAISTAHQLLRVPGPPPQIEVRAMRPGSFVVDLLVADPNIVQQVMDTLTSEPVGAVLDLSGLVGIVITSLALIKKLRNRRVARTEQIEPGLIRLFLEDGTVIETPPQSFQLVLDAAYRRHVRGVVEPLASNPGITQLTAISEDQSQHEVVTSEDTAAFLVPAVVEQELLDSTNEVVLRPVSVSFSEGNKWRFTDGETTFYAAIEDPAFIRSVELGAERFARGDLLRVRLRTRQTRAENGLRSERTVVQVLAHESGDVQLDLFAPHEDEQPEGPSSQGVQTA